MSAEAFEAAVRAWVNAWLGEELQEGELRAGDLRPAFVGLRKHRRRPRDQ